MDLAVVRASMYKNLPMRLNPGVPAAIPPINVRVGDTDWQSKFGWNAGGGASIGWGRTEVFFETRVIGFTADNAPMSRQMPFMFGLNWYLVVAELTRIASHRHAELGGLSRPPVFCR